MKATEKQINEKKDELFQEYSPCEMWIQNSGHNTRIRVVHKFLDGVAETHFIFKAHKWVQEPKWFKNEETWEEWKKRKDWERYDNMMAR